MKPTFQGWQAVATGLKERAEQQHLEDVKGDKPARLNRGQRASLHAIAKRITANGVLIADEVGMGKTRIAVEVASSVMKCGGRVAILVPPGLGYQWQAELREGGIDDVPPILRSLPAFFAAWEEPKPWFEQPALVVSHAFTQNWRLGENASPWRWALLPEIWATWRRKTGHRLPRGYRNNDTLANKAVRAAAASIVGSVPVHSKHPARSRLDELLSEVRWPRTLESVNYSKNNGDLRDWLERVVGVGLGVFDLVIIDEAHKNRDDNGLLAHLLEKVILQSLAVRRLALTATPVELDVRDWRHTFSRIGVKNDELDLLQQSIDQYAESVKRVRHAWRSSREARESYKKAAKEFQAALSPFLLRRDKREDPSVERFCRYSGLSVNAYRSEEEIAVETGRLTPAWRQAVCAAEALSLVTRQADDPIAKRLRLTLGNGHGVAALLDQRKLDDELDRKQKEFDETHGRAENAMKQAEDSTSRDDLKRQERAKWWLDSIDRAFDQDEGSLFRHPAIIAAVEAIELVPQDEKVLVFGRFNQPLRVLVELLNAREMLRRLQNGKPWPQAKVHVGDDSEWPAVRAAHGQLRSTLSLETLNKTLGVQYKAERQRREVVRGHLISKIEEGLKEYRDPHIHSIFCAFKRSARRASVTRALMESLGNRLDEVSTFSYAEAFVQLIDALSDRDDADEDRAMEIEEADAHWRDLESRLHEEYSRPQGGFARLMDGGTSPASRRMIQLAFNRANSFPRVLVAQSRVGSEGLNLHKSCRIVMLLHPEWNPGVVEQQIGRVDRVGSRWCTLIDSAGPAGPLPRIEVRPVIFRGTYDEHNWRVLRERWDEFRSQLHGVVIPPQLASSDTDHIIKELEEARPDFSPLKEVTSEPKRAVFEDL